MPADVMDPGSVIGVWATASRQRGRVHRDEGPSETAGDGSRFRVSAIR